MGSIHYNFYFVGYYPVTKKKTVTKHPKNKKCVPEADLVFEVDLVIVN